MKDGLLYNSFKNKILNEEELSTFLDENFSPRGGNISENFFKDIFELMKETSVTVEERGKRLDKDKIVSTNITNILSFIVDKNLINYDDRKFQSSHPILLVGLSLEIGCDEVFFPKLKEVISKLYFHILENSLTLSKEVSEKFYYLLEDSDENNNIREAMLFSYDSTESIMFLIREAIIRTENKDILEVLKEFSNDNMKYLRVYNEEFFLRGSIDD